jgi:hypothetical protein
MKTLFYILISFGLCSVAWADVQVKFRDVTGNTSTMRSNGQKVRINGGQMPGHVIIDNASGEFFVVDKKRNEIIRATPAEIGGSEPDDDLVVSLKARGSGEKIAGYRTGRFDLIANGVQCGTVFGSSELMKVKELRRMFEAMRGMHRLSSSMTAGMRGLLSECQRASTRLADLVDTSGFVLRVIDDKGNLQFEVESVRTDKKVAEDHYELPQGMKVVDMNEKMGQAMQQGQQSMQNMPDMSEIMQQIQQNGGEMTPEMQEQLQQMLEQLQQQQAQ